MTVVEEFESRFTGMIYILSRVLARAADGRLKPRFDVDLAYAPRRPRRA